MVKKESGKIPEYTRRAIEKYNKKFDRFTVSLPTGSRERIKELTGESANALINRLVSEELARLEKEKK